ncbi:cation:proton antiporter [Pontibacillus halophilus JSM 076056 = DSM 19796]|uniref:Cation:proton antiporter n=1 Tax=Pontibacillus halophilus JSM 076056 = DSM 19796 TaxID=1385510 RepID=A0A0A5GQQ3_9BACI|nr:Na+/H+ antiporter subunit D [Pontibacillus halophilus]KGX93548.1 cation:proton antiporter [Pontibacillus halophilus JSM 076056 = DSM 19796]
MSNLVVLPILIPLISGIIAAFLHRKIGAVRIFSRLMAVINLGVAAYMGWFITQNGTIILETGGWKAPYGIILVGDTLSALLVLTTNVIATACVFYASRSLTNKQESFYFYTFFFLLITGVSGAFLTGDLFNLFVFFEVLLMASYALIVLGNGKIQLRESLKYVLLNLFSSMLFVTVVAFLYSVVGTVNMAQIAERVQEVEQKGVLTTIGILLFFVFGTKAALFPLYYWLPKSYIAPNPVVSALFGALLTKVGIYSIMRTFSIIFYHKTDVTHEMFIWIAAFTLLFGVIGALSTHNVKLIVAYNIIPAVGFMLLGIGLFNGTSMEGSVYYLVHDMIIKAALFLLVGAIAYLAGTSDLRKMNGLIHHYPVLGWLFLIASVTLAGIPPFSGFIGKLLLLQGAAQEERIIMIIVGLVTSLLILYSMIRIFIQGFWGEKDETIVPDKKAARSFTGPIAFLLVFSIFLGIGAEFVLPSVEDVSNSLLNPSSYIQSVLKE